MGTSTLGAVAASVLACVLEIFVEALSRMFANHCRSVMSLLLSCLVKLCWMVDASFPEGAMIASVFVTVGCIRYMCLKKTVSEMRSALVFRIQIV